MIPHPSTDPVPAATRDDAGTRCAGFDVPDRPIRPSDLSVEALECHGLPPRPNPAAHPVLRQAWDAAFDRELTLIRFHPDAGSGEDAEGPPPRIAARRGRTLAPSASPSETSSNWAGAFISANQNKRFSQIWGSWTLPATLAFPPRPGAAGTPFLCSHWIGLDGQRRYIDASLPQIGTASQLDPDATSSAWAWVQWWARDAADNRPTKLPLPVAPGDKVLAVLTATDARSVTAVLVNLSPAVPVAVAVHVSAPPVEVGGATVVPKISGATAEWIVERPSVPGSTRIFNFPDYGSSTFELCVAVESDDLGLKALAAGVPQVLHGARLIRMLETETDPPSRVSILSLARRLSATSVRVDYGGFGSR